MQFKIKLTELGDNVRAWWEDYDHPSVKTQKDAFAYGKVLCEYWNSDLRPTEVPRKVVNARIIGVGKRPLKKRKELPGQLQLFNQGKRLQ